MTNVLATRITVKLSKFVINCQTNEKLAHELCRYKPIHALTQNMAFLQMIAHR